MFLLIFNDSMYFTCLAFVRVCIECVGNENRCVDLLPILFIWANSLFMLLFGSVRGSLARFSEWSALSLYVLRVLLPCLLIKNDGYKPMVSSSISSEYEGFGKPKGTDKKMMNYIGEGHQYKGVQSNWDNWFPRWDDF